MGEQIPSDYVVLRAAASTPVLRPINEPITDYLVIPKHGLPPGCRMFWDHLRFYDGTHKIPGVHTNMTDFGCLRYPVMFDLIGFKLHIVQHESSEDVLAVMKSLNFRFEVYNTTQAQFAASDMTPSTDLNDLKKLLDGIDEKDKDKAEIKKIYDKVLEQIEEFRRSGCWRWFSYRTSSHGMPPTRIEPKFQFFLSVNQSELKKPLKGDVHVKIHMCGKKYVPV